MPDNVHVLTLEPWVNGTHLLRLEHVYDAGEDQTLAQPATVELDVIFFKVWHRSAVNSVTSHPMR